MQAQQLIFYYCYYMLDTTTNEEVVRSGTDAMQVLKAALTAKITQKDNGLSTI